ncbi:hypothetical protein [Silvibacterium dinghuense]|uniref:Uncharacterized protein n=1 Tax=Silvibacterium dinghuense TaxID=1560006 RepID=A0A4Q1SGA2_9BACT|nr:hypothetical protein [Silvibacterium dinghuense]RXS96571.1 hypothetical protein ESZ00_01045 [Silvibacterium dinghuense]
MLFKAQTGGALRRAFIKKDKEKDSPHSQATPQRDEALCVARKYPRTAKCACSSILAALFLHKGIDPAHLYLQNRREIFPTW